MPRKIRRPTQTEIQAKSYALAIDRWRVQAFENLKRALRAEAALARFEGPIDGTDQLA